MQLTSFTDYSLRLLMYLAAQQGERRATIAEVAAAFSISENHLTKVAHLLGKRGWITATRGRNGGLSLAKAPADICLGQVVRDTEGTARPAECFEKTEHCVLTPACQLKKVLSESVRAFYEVLDHYTLDDIAQNRAQLRNVLRIVPV